MEGGSVTDSFGRLRFSGGRYEQPGMPLSAAAELERFERLVAEVARLRYLADHPERRRAPRGFRSVGLRLTRVEPGSVVPVLERPSSGQTALPVVDHHQEALELICQALDAINDDKPLPERFPERALSEFAQFGRSLQPDERLELGTGGRPPALLQRETRARIQRLAHLNAIEVETVLTGQLTGLASEPPQLTITLPGEGRRQLAGPYTDPALWDDLRGYLGQGERAPLASFSVIASQTPDGTITAIIDVLAVESALPAALADRLQELSTLADGWLQQGVPAPNESALRNTESLLLSCVDEGLPQPDIYPSADGGVQLEWRMPKGGIEIEMLNDNTSTWCRIGSGAANDEYQEHSNSDTDSLVTRLKGALGG